MDPSTLFFLFPQNDLNSTKHYFYKKIFLFNPRVLKFMQLCGYLRTLKHISKGTSLVNDEEELGSHRT